MAKQSVLLTGATGFIGRHLLRKLSSLDDLQLVCIIRGGEANPHAECLLKQGAVIISGAFYDESVIRKAFDQYHFEQVIHLAAIRGGGKASAAEFDEVNVKGTERLLKHAREQRAQKFIFCSSVGVYGTIPVGVPAGNETPLRGDNRYHQSKIDAEEAVQAYIRDGFNAYIVRPTITYGVGDDGFPQTLVNLVKGRLLWLPKSSHQVHMVDVDRLAEVFFKLVIRDYPTQRLFVVGDISPIALSDLAEWIHWRLYGRSYPRFRRLPDWVFKLAFYVFEGLRNEKWAARIALLSNDWYYQCSDTYRLLGIQPVLTKEGFTRLLRDMALSPEVSTSG